MSNAEIDQNSVKTMTAALESDGATVVKITANPNSHALSVSNGASGSNFGPEDALKDENFRSTLVATSLADGQTPVVLYADASGALLVQST